MKTCGTCRKTKPLTEFYVVAANQDGSPRYRSDCKDCHKAKAAAIQASPAGRARAKARYESGGKERQREYYRKMRSEEFFKWRARLWSNRWRVTVTEDELIDLWDQQGGLCPLSGRTLGDDAHLDHVWPQSRGGSHTIENLRWLDPVVNVMLQDMTDAEFVTLCQIIVERADR